MTSNPYVPVGRLDTEPAPAAPFPTPTQREAALRETLRGVDLGAYDERLIGWAVRTLDNPTLRTIASWVERARRAEPLPEIPAVGDHGHPSWCGATMAHIWPSHGHEPGQPHTTPWAPIQAEPIAEVRIEVRIEVRMWAAPERDESGQWVSVTEVKFTDPADPERELYTARIREQQLHDLTGLLRAFVSMARRDVEPGGTEGPSQ